MPKKQSGKTATEPHRLNLQLLKASDLTELQALVRQGADLDFQDSDGETVLIRAFAHLDMVRYLVSQGAAINAQNTYGDTALLWAAGAGKSDVVTFLLQQGANPNLIGRVRGTALMHAARRNQRRSVEILLTQGANINVSDRQGQTALSIAISYGHIGLAELLKKRGADGVGTLKEVRQAARRSRDAHALLAAIDRGSSSQVQALLERGTDPNFTSEEKKTPLGEALFYHNEQAVALLLEHGAVPDPLHKGTDSPLLEACWGGETTIVRHLLAAGANLNISSRYGTSPLERAIGFLRDINEHRLALVKLLLEAGADPNRPDEEGTPLLTRVQAALTLRLQQGEEKLTPVILTELKRYYEMIKAEEQEQLIQARNLTKAAASKSKAQRDRAFAQSKALHADSPWPLPSPPVLAFFTQTYQVAPTNHEEVRALLEDLQPRITEGRPETLQALIDLLKAHGATPGSDPAPEVPLTPLQCLGTVFGSSDIPPLLRQLCQLEDELQHSGQSLDTLYCTLLDAIPDVESQPPGCFPFAYGINGTCFALYSTGKKRADLSSMPVVMYSEELEPQARMVAATLRQFLSLVLTVRNTDLIDGIDMRPDSADDFAAHSEEGSEQWQKILAVCHQLQHRLRLRKLPNPSLSVAQCRQKYREIEQWTLDE